MKLKGLLLIFCFLGIVSTSLAQEYSKSKSKKANKQFEEAVQLQNRREWGKAAELYRGALKADKTFAEAYYRLGNLMIVLSDYYKNEGIKHLEAYIRHAGTDTKVSEAALRISKFYLDSGKYERANEFFQKVNTSQLTGQKITDYNLLQMQLPFALAEIQKAQKVDVKEMPATLNAFALQYNPSFSGDGNYMIYTVRLGTKISDDENIYESEKDASGNWKLGKPLKGAVNSVDNEGSATITADGNTMVFTGCERNDGKGSCDLYIAYRSQGLWSAPENLSVINSKNWDSQPSLSADGSEIYFSSNRPGGYGGYDIWIAKKNAKGEWMLPENAGPEINTEKDEFTPFIHQNNNTLFYSSNGKVGMGGLDIYYAYKKLPGVFYPGVNVGFPINTHLQETGLVISADGSTAYFNEELRGSSQSRTVKIKQYPLPKNIKINPAVSYVKGKVFNKFTKEPIGAKVNLIDVENEMNSYSVRNDPFNGKYLAITNAGRKYAFFVSEPGYLYNSVTLKTDSGDNPKPLEINFALEPIKKGARTTLSNLFFDTNKWTLRDESKAELEKLLEFMNINPSVSVIIEGHTDEVGKGQNNLQLSNNRANAVKEFLVKRGVSTKRLTSIGYGETRPIVKTGGEAQENRRIELLIK